MTSSVKRRCAPHHRLTRTTQDKRGLTLSEIIMAIGFLAVFTTGLLAVATKGFLLSGKEVDMAAAYQHTESLMENFTHKATRTESWQQISSIPEYTNPVSLEEDGTEVPDPNFCYTVEVRNLGSTLKKVQVRMFVADTSEPSPTPDTTKVHGGEVLKMTNFYSRP